MFMFKEFGMTKETEPDLAIIEVGQEYLDFQLERFRREIMHYDAIKQGLAEPERCEKCDFCKATKVLKKPITMEDLSFDYPD